MGTQARTKRALHIGWKLRVQPASNGEDGFIARRHRKGKAQATHFAGVLSSSNLPAQEILERGDLLRLPGQKLRPQLQEPRPGRPAAQKTPGENSLINTGN